MQLKNVIKFTKHVCAHCTVIHPSTNKCSFTTDALRDCSQEGKIESNSKFDSLRIDVTCTSNVLA